MQGNENGICGVQSSIGVGFFPSPVHCTYLSHEGGGGGSRGPLKAAAGDPLPPLLQPLTLPCGPPTPVKWVLGLFPRVNQSRHSTDHPPQPTAKVNARVELYLYSPSEPSRQVTG
jgi:hypothetical protein